MKKNERGAITLFILIAILFFIIVLINLYVSSSNKTSSQDKDITSLKEQYTVTGEEMQQAYEVKVNEKWNNLPEMVFSSTGETYPWYAENGYYFSGNQSQANSTSTVRSNTFTLVANTEFTFEWAVSSESPNYDYIYYTIYKDGSAMSDTGTNTKIGGNGDSITTVGALSYTTATKTLAPGTYYIEFTYRKDGSANKGLDAGYIRNVKLGGKDAIFNLSVYEEQTPTITFSSTGETYPWYSGGGYYYSGNQNQSSSTSTVKSDTFTLAKDTEFTFEWAASSESSSYDYIYYTIYKDGSAMSGTGESTKIGGNGDSITTVGALSYTTVTKTLTAGTYYIEFTYKKDGSVNKGLDAGYIRNVKLGRKDAVFNLSAYVVQTPTITFSSTGETYPWYSGGGYYYSGNQNQSSSTSTVKSDTFTLAKDTEFTFEWAVSSESSSYDYIYYTIYKDGSTMSGTGESTKIGGNGDSITTVGALSYTTVTNTLTVGTYYIEFTYRKDGSVNKGLDAGYIRNVKLGGKDAVFNLSAYAVQTPTITFSSTGETYPWRSGEGYWVSGNQKQSSSTSTVKSNTFTLAKDTEFTFEWAASSESSSYDYLYYTIYKDGSAMSDTGTNTKIGGNGDSITTVGALSYTTVTKTLTAGTYYIEFTYRKDGSVDKGLDAGYVRNVKLGGKDALSSLESEPTVSYYSWNYNSSYSYYVSQNSGINNSIARHTQKVNVTSAGGSNYIDIEFAISADAGDKLVVRVYKPDGTLHSEDEFYQDLNHTYDGFTSLPSTNGYLGGNVSYYTSVTGEWTIEIDYVKDESGGSGMDCVVARIGFNIL